MLPGSVVREIGYRWDRRDIAILAGKLPDKFQKPVLKKYQQLFEAPQNVGAGRFSANTFLRETVEATSGAAWRVSSSDDDLCRWAKMRADSCRRVMVSASDLELAWLVISEICQRSGVEPEEVSEKRTVGGAVARMACPLWWRRRVRVTHGRKVEGSAISIGLVGSGAGLYASDETVNRRWQQRGRNRAMLESCLAVNELGQEYTLAQLSDLSVSNPIIRRGELMMRMAGFEQVARRSGHVGEFYTWTCPSRMHRNSDKWDGTTPRQAQQYLCKQWSKARAALSRRDIRLYGFRVAEPHQDGCPHWHMLFFFQEEHAATVRKILGHYALQVDGNEKGAAEHRFTAVTIDWSKGTASGYLAKYVSKNIDAFGIDLVDEDLTGRRDPKECAKRVDAWASCWGVRQFQQVGGPPVTVWRELRRLGETVQSGETIEAARCHADVANWAGFVDVMGGPESPRDAMPVKLHKVASDRPGRYGDGAGDVIIGLAAGSVVIITRVHEWRVEHRNKQAKIDLSGSGSGSSERGFGLQSVAPWSSVNNCTRGENERRCGTTKRDVPKGVSTASFSKSAGGGGGGLRNSHSFGGYSGSG